jgi:spore germination protein KB
MKKHRCYLLLILGMIILFTSIKMESNITEHLKIGLKIVPYYLHLPFQVGIPLLLLIAAWIRKRTERV